MSGVRVYAARGALETARRLGFPGVLETEVEQAILAGRKRRLGERERLVDLDAFTVRVLKDGTTPQGRRRWRITHIERHGNTTNGRNNR